MEHCPYVYTEGVFPGVCDAGSCYLQAVCKTRKGFATAERWFEQNRLSRVSCSRCSQFFNAVDALARGVIDKDAYESPAVSALCLQGSMCKHGSHSEGDAASNSWDSHQASCDEQTSYDNGHWDRPRADKIHRANRPCASDALGPDARKKFHQWVIR